MLGKFFYGQLSLREAFWKFSVLGLIVLGFISRLLMIQLKQSLNYEGNFINVAMRSLSFFRTEVSTMVYFAFYCASFLALVA
ncbi:MAG: hypothetical protein J6W96_06560, partial [Alphaproteobacteria bacterium]|nr:hypothetical protein [Alphaproteobacteria bacterium]